MGRKVKTFKIDEFYFLSKEFKNNVNFNEIDWVVAEYLFSLESIRKNKKNNGVEVLDYDYTSLITICENTGIKAKQTVLKSLSKLEYYNVIKIIHSKSRKLANQYIINPEWMNQPESKVEEPVIEKRSVDNIISDSSLQDLKELIKTVIRQNEELKDRNEALLGMVNDLKNELTQLKQCKNQNPVFEQAVISHPSIDAPLLIAEEEPVIETRSIEPIKEEPVEKATVSISLKKALKFYDEINKKNQESLKSNKQEDPVIEIRNFKPVQPPKPKKEYTEAQLMDSFVNRGVAVYGLDNPTLKKELDYRIQRGIDTTNIIKDVIRRKELYERRTDIDNKGFFIIFEDILKTA